MRISLDQVEALVWIARSGSFRAAAHRLNVSQPAISGRIRELERQLGGALFHRDDYRPRLTDLGLQTLRHAEQILALARALEEQADPAKTLRGPIRMGFADSFALTHLPALLGRAEKIYPTAEFAIVIDFSANLDRKLQAGDLDFAILTEPEANPDIAIEPLQDLDLAWVAGRSLDLPDRPLTPADLKHFPIITNPRPSKLYGTIQSWFANLGDAPQRFYTCNSLTMMGTLAAKGFGLSVLPVTLLQGEFRRAALRIIPVRPALPKHHLAIAYRIDPAGPNLKPLRDIAHALVAAPGRRESR
jgi:DNA-binding transcriptional LysR family regulator